MDHNESWRVGWAGLTAALLAALMLWSCGRTKTRVSSSRPGDDSSRADDRALSAVSPDSVLLVGAGDVGDEGHRSEATYSLVRRIFEHYGGPGCPGGGCAGESDGGTARGRVFIAGDVAYPDGTPQNFIDDYGPTWGQLAGNSWPAAGTHEYGDYARTDANGYFDFFSGRLPGFPQASPAPLNRPDGWYAYDWGRCFVEGPAG
jgi:hypothetical protein